MVKYLTICDGGNVRSHALASMLKMQHGREAIAIGRLFVSPDTMNLMCGWADIVVVMQDHMKESVPPEYTSKIRCVEVGIDRWGLSVPQDLLEYAQQGANWLVANEPSEMEITDQ